MTFPSIEQYDFHPDASNETQLYWQNNRAVIDKYRRYYTGDVFKTKIPLETGVDSDIEMYPVGLNLVKMLCLAQADSLWGEWDDEILSFGVTKDTEFLQPERDASIMMSKILKASNGDSFLWELGLDREIYGGCAIKISPAPAPSLVKWSRISLDSFYPVWDPEDDDILLEVFIVTEVTKDQARLKYGLKTNKDTVVRIEHWTNEDYEITLDGKRIDTYSGKNPYGIVPFVYIPRMRSTSWWGDALTKDVMRVQDEMNERIADIGEAVHYNSHPTRWGINLPKSFNTDNYPLAPNVLWDLGRKMGDWPEPKVGILQSDNPIPNGVFEFVSFLYDWGRISSAAPPIAFGEDEGGSQRSGITLEIRMWPLIKATRRSRGYMNTGIKRAMKISAIIMIQKAYDFVSKKALQVMLNGELDPQFAQIMPRDQAALVDEIVKRLSTNPPTISLETAVKRLGEGVTEVDKIKQDLIDYPRNTPQEQGNSGTVEKVPQK